jgi:peptide/nickel transport system ATP-binding protein
VVSAQASSLAAHRDGGVGAPGAGVLLDVAGLTVRYGASPTAAVDDVSLCIRPGERVALVGESGSGKTTLGLALAGFLTQTDVTVTFDRLTFAGQPMARRGGSRLPRRTPGLSMVFQDAMTSLDPVWTIGQQLRAVLSAEGGRSRSQVGDLCRLWLERVGLHQGERVLRSRPYELSGGMRQRVMLALALCGNPQLLIADEPTSALDASLSRDMMDLLVRLVDEFGTSLLIVSHDIQLCQEYSDRMVVMYGGRLVEEGPSATLDKTATHPYTVGLMSCVPTLDSASLDELPTLDTFQRIFSDRPTQEDQAS